MSWIVRVVMVLAILEIGCWLIGRFVPGMAIRPTSEIFEEQTTSIQRLLDPKYPHLEEIHPVLGWRYYANHKSEMHQLNSQALRSDREYAPLPPPGVLRIGAFGDSVVYCSEVDNANAWPELMEKNNPDFEVLNFGVPGYGLDQAYLRYQVDGRPLAPRVVLIGFASDDIWRVVAYYWRFRGDTAFPLFKPRFTLDDKGELSLVEIPVRSAADYDRLAGNPREILQYGRYDAFYRPSVYENPLYDYSATVRVGSLLANRVYERFLDPERSHRGQVFNEDATMFKINLAIFEKFVADVRKDGALPLVVFLPDRISLERIFEGGPALYDPLVARLRDKGIDCLDVRDAFLEAGPASDIPGWYAPRGHYSAAGNRIIAAWLSAQVRKKVPDLPRAGKEIP